VKRWLCPRAAAPLSFRGARRLRRSAPLSTSWPGLTRPSIFPWGWVQDGYAGHLAKPASRRPHMHRCGAAALQKRTLNIFSYILLTISLSGLFSPSSCPTERGDRDRHDCGAGCGGRRRCGVTRFMGNVCLRAGRIGPDLPLVRRRPALRWKDPLDSVTDDQFETRPAYSLEATLALRPGHRKMVMRIDRQGRCAGNRKNTACGTPGTCPAPPKALMHSLLRKTAFASGPRVQWAPGVPRALLMGVRLECSHLGRLWRREIARAWLFDIHIRNDAQAVDIPSSNGDAARWDS
jgi:hypothetical protein